jgi:hypothetical protein
VGAPGCARRSPLAEDLTDALRPDLVRAGSGGKNRSTGVEEFHGVTADLTAVANSPTRWRIPDDRRDSLTH